MAQRISNHLSPCLRAILRVSVVSLSSYRFTSRMTFHKDSWYKTILVDAVPIEAQTIQTTASGRVISRRSIPGICAHVAPSAKDGDSTSAASL